MLDCRLAGLMLVLDERSSRPGICYHDRRDRREAPRRRTSHGGHEGIEDRILAVTSSYGAVWVLHHHNRLLRELAAPSPLGHGLLGELDSCQRVLSRRGPLGHSL